MGSLVLGPVVFRSFEVPERISFGGKQRLAIHALAGGGRVVDAMGDEDAPITWSGVFSGPEAADRVRLLERIRRAGAAVPLSWEAWRFTVVLEVFQAQALSPAWIPYRVKACVVEAAETALPAEEAFVFTVAEAVLLGAESGLEGAIAGASAGLQGADIGVAIASAGSLARLVTARAFLANAGAGS